MLKEKIVKICDLFIEYGILAIIFFVPLIMDFTIHTYNMIDLYKVVFFRVVLSIILLSFIAKIFISEKLSYRGSSNIFLFAGLMLLSFFMSSLFSLEPNQSFWGSFFRQQGFYNFFNYILFFVLLILNLKNYKQVKRIIITVILSATFTTFYGLIQYFSLDPIRWSAEAIAGRIFSTLGQPNFYGHFLVMVLPFAVYALIFIAKNFWHRLFFVLVILAQLFCLIFTYSRAAWLGFIGAAVALILFFLCYKGFKKFSLAIIVLMIMGIFTIVGLNLSNPVKSNLNSINLTSRLKSIVDFRSGSNKIRLYYFESAIDEIKQASYLRLLFGFGPETLENVFRKHYQMEWGVYEAINTVPDRAHNWLFDQLLSLGLIGLAVTLTFYFYFIYQLVEFLFKQRKLEYDGWLSIFLSFSLIGYFINVFFSFSLFTNLVYLFLILAICWFVINSRQEEKIINFRLTRFSKLFIWLFLLAVLVVFIYTNNVNQVRAEIYYIKYLKAIRKEDCQAAIRNMEKTLSLSPNSIYYQENYIYLNLKCLIIIKDKSIKTEIGSNLLSFIESIKDKHNYNMLDYTARAYTLFGDDYYGQAEKIFNDLILDYPHIFTAYEYLGKLKMTQGDYVAEINYYKKAIEVLPPLDHPYLNDQHRDQIKVELVRLYELIGLAYVNIKDYDSALNYYKKGLSLNPHRATLYKDIADIYYLQNKLDEAINFNKRGFMLNPDDYHWPLSLSLLYRDKKDLTAAKDYLNQAIRLKPENQDLKNYYKELNKL